ncbi:YigZ family protein [Aerococcaceae bacterium zg-ZJ1578]|uniref:YigZ family protein n=1 Tax=Aerococcaceae TaxID=186827 RepID=UPI0013BE458F|nr:MULTISPECIES: YigZ family protein [unclassified Facklamia]MBK0347960.1 YigZ family protein [Aerococcaceae bacterium zg-1578]MBR7927817.1 YigZ family protein [Aerococcaceae bacterium zg-ZUI334]MBS4462620.1 YigZ family protein [Aerococcaceae bacterium zg-B36]QQD65578.1 YigZ family protein [Aerococcaceae bacterium zg-252]NEW64980.1 YigZ family protein [Facklamia sp. 252]
MSQNYRSIAEKFIDEIEIKKSRFITYLMPIESEEQAQLYIAQIKKEHYKANHHCSAYILNEDASIQRMSDDGEPSGTAGVPMLEVLKKQELTNILAVVVRYFGGTKLGAGGLVRAYSGAVSEALVKAELIQNITQSIIELTLNYAQVDTFQYHLSKQEIEATVLDTQYTDKVSYQLAIDLLKVESVNHYLISIFNGQFDWQEIGEQRVNIPINR